MLSMRKAKSSVFPHAEANVAVAAGELAREPYEIAYH